MTPMVKQTLVQFVHKYSFKTVIYGISACSGKDKNFTAYLHGVLENMVSAGNSNSRQKAYEQDTRLTKEQLRMLQEGSYAKA